MPPSTAAPRAADSGTRLRARIPAGPRGTEGPRRRPRRRGRGRELHEAADRLAQSLGTLGYDYADPLYHRILGTAKSDGAFYTNNLSAIMLARLALTDDFTDWSDLKAVRRLRIMDPACGTGTLLMAALQAVKAQAARAGAAAHDDPGLHRDIVENVLCGLDINAHAIQLAACNLTLGAPTVDHRRMNLGTMPHGPQAGDDVRATTTVVDSEGRQAPTRACRPRDAVNYAVVLDDGGTARRRVTVVDLE